MKWIWACKVSVYSLCHLLLSFRLLVHAIWVAVTAFLGPLAKGDAPHPWNWLNFCKCAYLAFASCMCQRHYVTPLLPCSRQTTQIRSPRPNTIGVTTWTGGSLHTARPRLVHIVTWTNTDSSDFGGVRGRDQQGDNEWSVKKEHSITMTAISMDSPPNHCIFSLHTAAHFHSQGTTYPLG